jgi:hypothetical protein
MNRNGRHNRKGKSDDEQQFFHTLSFNASAPCQNEIYKVFCFQKTNSAVIRVLSAGEVPPNPTNNVPLPDGQRYLVNRREIRSEFRSDYQPKKIPINAKNRPVSRAVFLFILKNQTNTN